MPDVSSAVSSATTSFHEPTAPSVSSDDLKALATKMVGGPSLLDGITEPIDLEQVKYKIFKSLLPSLAQLANDLGYGWVSGVNGKFVGDEYLWVPTGEKGGSSYYQVTGPAFAPNMAGQGSGYMWDKRTSIEFTDVHFTFSTPAYSNQRFLDSTVETLNTFTIDNTTGLEKITTSFDVEYYQTGHVGAATQKSWQSSWNFSASATETFSVGTEGMMFPSFSMSLTEEAGLSGTSGGSQSFANDMTQGNTTRTTSTATTPIGAKGVYAAQVNSGKAAIDFTTNVTLSFGVKFHGFLRWGGGKPFVGDTNYHVDYSGNGSRPTFEYTFGSKDVPFWTALQQQSSTNASPWAWDKLFANIPTSKTLVEGLCKAPASCTFPVSGVMAGIQRSDYNFKVVSTDFGGQNDTSTSTTPVFPTETGTPSVQPATTSTTTAEPATSAITPVAQTATPSQDTGQSVSDVSTDKGDAATDTRDDAMGQGNTQTPASPLSATTTQGTSTEAGDSPAEASPVSESTLSAPAQSEAPNASTGQMQEEPTTDTPTVVASAPVASDTATDKNAGPVGTDTSKTPSDDQQAQAPASATTSPAETPDAAPLTSTDENQTPATVTAPANSSAESQDQQ